jgi:hypothetical protein
VLVDRVDRRGFLERATIAEATAVGEPAWTRARADRRLGTLRALRFPRFADAAEAEFAASPMLVGLRSITVESDRMLRELARVTLPTVEELRIDGDPATETMDQIARLGDALPALRRLTFLRIPMDGVDALVARVAESPIVHRVEELALEAWHGDTAAWFGLLDARRMVRRATLVTRKASIAVRWPELVVEVESDDGTELEPLMALPRIARLVIVQRNKKRRLAHPIRLRNLLARLAPAELDLPKTWANQIARS